MKSAYIMSRLQWVGWIQLELTYNWCVLRHASVNECITIRRRSGMVTYTVKDERADAFNVNLDRLHNMVRAAASMF